MKKNSRPLRKKNAQHIWEPQLGKFKKAGKGILMCRVCANVFFKKRWLKDLSALPRGTQVKHSVTFDDCPACAMAQEKLFEGEIVIFNAPIRIRKDLLNLILAFGDRAKARDPQDRIIAIQTRGNRLYVTTTENQLAVRLAKKISKTFPTRPPEIRYAKEPQEVARIAIAFPTTASTR